MKTKLEDLVGHRVKKLEVSEKQESLLFTLDDDSQVFLDTDSDCCSETWFADIVGLSLLRDGKITAAKEIPLPEPQDKRTRQESDAQYGILLDTDAGPVTIVYRNSSNGYYGGSLVQDTTYRRRYNSDDQVKASTWTEIKLSNWEWTA